MKILAVEDYQDFKCIGDQCPITCCGGGWNIAVDPDSAKYYRSIEGEFGEKLKKNLKDVQGMTAFQLDKQGDCPFLDENKLCDIYKNLGQDKMCYVCKTYPRLQYQVGDVVFIYLTNSCPEVTRCMLQRQKPLQVLFDEQDLPDTVKNTDWKEFNYAIRAYTVGMDLLQNRELWVQERLGLLLVFLSQFQELMKQGKDPSGLITVFSDRETYYSFLQELPIYDRDYKYKIKAFSMVFSNLFSAYYEHPMWKACKELADCIGAGKELNIDELAKAFDRGEIPEMQLELEQLLAYRFFAVFMQGFENSDYFEKVAYECNLYIALLSYMALTEIVQDHVCSQEERVLFYSLCSRTDHNKGRKKDLNDAIHAEGMDKLEVLLKLIS